jgi:3-phenylpropionate/cinnamic acid dioxygenase small subunit
MTATINPTSRVDLWFDVTDFYAHYASTIDRKQPLEWIDTFVEDGVYRVGTHNNVSTTGMWWYTDRGLAALKERAAYTHGYFWKAPDKTLHSMTNLRVRAEAVTEYGGRSDVPTYDVTGAFVMFVADRGDQSTLYVCGEFSDTLVRTDDGLRIFERRVVIDSETVPPNMGVLL